MTPRLAAWRRRTDAPLLILAIGSLPMLLLDLKRHDLAYHDRVFLDIVNIVVLVAFAVDYGVELAVAGNRRKYVRREWTSALIVVAQALALAPALTAVGALRILRAGRAWRAIAVLGRVFAIGGAAAREGRDILRRHAARFALGLPGSRGSLPRSGSRSPKMWVPAGGSIRSETPSGGHRRRSRPWVTETSFRSPRSAG